MALPCPWTCHHLSSFLVLLHGMFLGSGSGLIGCGTVLRSGILAWCGGSSRSVFHEFFGLFPLVLQVCTQGTYGSSRPSEESCSCSAGCGLSALVGSVIHFSSNCWLFLVDPSCFSTALFLLVYCLPPTLCSFLQDITRWTTLNNRPHFLATSLMFLALLTM